MYTWEIENLLKIKNHLLNGKEHEEVTVKSPQVKKVEYNAYEDTFQIWTYEEDHSSYNYKYRVKRKPRL